jgi:hypothetical protein
MRGQQERSGSLFSYVSIEERIPASHPLRRIRKLADQALNRLNPTGVGRAGASFRARGMGALSTTEKTAGSDQPIPTPVRHGKKFSQNPTDHRLLRVVEAPQT